MEAMSLGLPVIGTKLGGTPDQIAEGESGFLIPPSNPKALAQALNPLLEDPHLRESMSRAARTRIETHFPISETIRKIELAYRSAL